jgi:hypothetical protein
MVPQAWLTRDLEAANKNRQQVPWIIVTSHYPIFLSTMQATSVYVPHVPRHHYNQSPCEALVDYIILYYNIILFI